MVAIVRRESKTESRPDTSSGDSKTNSVSAVQAQNLEITRITFGVQSSYRQSQHSDMSRDDTEVHNRHANAPSLTFSCCRMRLQDKRSMKPHDYLALCLSPFNGFFHASPVGHEAFKHVLNVGQAHLLAR